MVSPVPVGFPVFASGGFPFRASSILHMILPFHKNDYKKLPDEEAARAALRGVPAGIYMFPACDHKNMKEPAMQEKFKQGPVGTLVLRRPGLINMGPFLSQWFGY